MKALRSRGSSKGQSLRDSDPVGRAQKALRPLCIFATALLVLVVGLWKPYYNWDVIGYVAASYAADGLSDDRLSLATFSEVRRELGAAATEALSTGENAEYRATVFASPAALQQQVPLYAIRVLYVQIIRALGRLGIPYAKGTYVVSAISSSAAVIVLGLLVSQTGLSIAWLPLVAAVTGFTEISRLSTPDALACFLALSAVYAALLGNRLVFPICICLPLARTDFVLLSLTLMTVTFLPARSWLAILTMSLAVGAVLLANSVNGSYGWLTMFNFTFVEMTPFPAALVPSSNPYDYVHPYAGVALSFLLNANRHTFLYFFAGFFVIANFSQVWRSHQSRILFLVPLVFVFTHLALYPLYLARYFVFATSTLSIGLLAVLSAHIEMRRSEASR